ncbi:hypothetical protein [Clostridium felsineum]|nr:hypothetical protein [Clostridium felsineum]
MKHKLQEGIIHTSVIALVYPDEAKIALDRFDLGEVHNEVW